MDAIYRKHHPDGLITSYISGDTGCRQLRPARPMYYGVGSQESPDFIGPRTRLHQALFDLGQMKRGA